MVSDSRSVTIIIDALADSGITSPVSAAIRAPQAPAALTTLGAAKLPARLSTDQTPLARFSARTGAPSTIVTPARWAAARKATRVRCGSAAPSFMA